MSETHGLGIAGNRVRLNTVPLNADLLIAQSVAQQQVHCRMYPERLQAG